MLWSTDWPHPNIKTHMPDDGGLVDLLTEIAPDAEHLKELLVDNSTRLYQPEMVSGPVERTDARVSYEDTRNWETATIPVRC